MSYKKNKTLNISTNDLREYYGIEEEFKIKNMRASVFNKNVAITFVKQLSKKNRLEFKKYFAYKDLLIMFKLSGWKWKFSSYDPEHKIITADVFRKLKKSELKNMK